ncbi:MAG: tRNA preQ1(34) S-adenosylmethionine ribosyltransferase-isomerase QueA [Candidatus Omnitrophica bacterium]|nr:tRNA preQ1(34) S-adenosylmethionine ribosyltransferase-isomerase QueA [Candidatus Omnitrophota bacterium]
MRESVYSISQYEYDLPRVLIAQKPAIPRDSSRLLILDRKKKSMEERVFSDIGQFLGSGDLLVLNNTEVIKARLLGETVKKSKIEVLLLKEQKTGFWQALVKPGRKAMPGSEIYFAQGKIKGRIVEKTSSGTRIICFEPKNIQELLDSVGKIPLPPYIKEDTKKDDDYQTVYAKEKGAVAAPTAGLHFTTGLLQGLRDKGVEVVYLTLHCGLATFRPVKCQDIREHDIESEMLEITPDSAKKINQAKDQQRRIIAVGTTVIRALESAAYKDPQGNFRVRPFNQETRLFIVPGYTFRIVDAVITNFHTPRSTNLILLASFCGLELIKNTYSYAKDKKMRFFSFGDAMFIQ